MTEEEQAAYDAGYLSYPDENCPHEANTKLWEAWWNGYAQCDLDSAFWID